ncbi:MAG TPA: hypothetical protein VFI06_16725 [Chitinophagaceae bacterium]|nr:hypothetical protein [Chitinophagaceae bacterium]
MSKKQAERLFRGDLLYDSATGHYSIYGKKLYILFDKQELDINNAFQRSPRPVKTTIVNGDSITFHVAYYLGHNKLFFAHTESGKKVTRAVTYRPRKKYLLFGTHYYNKRHYLQRSN